MSLSKKIYDTLCSKCTGCGEKAGFHWLEYPYNPSHHNISTSEKNESHDLRLLTIVQKRKTAARTNPNTETGKQMIAILNKIHYAGIYGTPQNLNITSQKIYNVNGAYEALKTAVDNAAVQRENSAKYHVLQNKIGDLYVYMDGKPMKYESV